MPEDTTNSSEATTPAASAESLGEPKPAAAEGSSEAKNTATPDVAEGSVEAKPSEEPSPVSSSPSKSESIPESTPIQGEPSPVSTSLPQPPLDSSGGQESSPEPVVPLSESELLAAEIAQRKSLKPSNRFMRWLIAKGLAAKKLLIKKRLDKIMSLFDQHDKLTRVQVEKILRVSLHTADSDLDLLEKEGKIKQVGTRGWGVFYTKV